MELDSFKNIFHQFFYIFSYKKAMDTRLKYNFEIK